MAASGAGGEQIYATLLLSDSYLPGALVLAHSLRDAGTHRKLAVLVTLDSVSADSITQLKAVYDYIFPVPRIRNDNPANLYLMNRGDLHSAFTKINLWKLTQFSKIVYIDADIVAYRAPDELFDITHPFSAAPDIGWPDLFNTGVMVLTPNMGDFYAMIAMAERGISFDGADQGLINMHFGNQYNRISFTYNVTPSAHYQYVPAYRHFQSSINMVHFIGANKPWFTGRDAPRGTDPFNDMESAPEKGPTAPEYVQYFTKGEWHPQPAHEQPPAGEHHSHGQQGSASGGHHAEHQPHHDGHDHGHEHHPQDSGHRHEQHHDQGSHGGAPAPGPTGEQARQEHHSEHHSTEHHHHGGASHVHQHTEPKNEPPPITMHSWDAQRQPPPSDSKPEAMNFPSTHYEMSQDTAPFVPPERYPSPPKNMWYEVPKEPPAPPSKAPSEIFPWERNRPPPTRSFAEPPAPEPQPEPVVEPTPQPLAVHTGGPPHQPSGQPLGQRSGVSLGQPSGQHSGQQPGQQSGQPSGDHSGEPLVESSAKSSTGPSATTEVLSESAGVASSTTEAKSEPSTPVTPTVQIIPSDPWTSFTRVNAWDEVPEIERYVEGLRGHRRGKSSGSLGRIKSPSTTPWRDDRGVRLRGMKLTDFPSAAERPSLPVTPAPIHRQSFWSGDDGGHGGARQLPEAEGVPSQSDWDPLAQLQKLAKQQSDVLLKKLGGGDEGEGRESGAGGSATGVLSPQPVKGKRSASILREMSSSSGPEATTTSKPSSIPEPSYSGPGAAWERGEDFLERETPLPPREEDLDVLET
ncbi:glycogenin glucosyltransferase [Fusarium piperis]|uniref:glycogenin glucosyltransferase n=1 Tax=Fusarium piperis TaxID=1435070 RepID=A0A9W8WCH8_9HYPO|nr:glycogenin glucosyltransferase [Fusarium piperis]